MQLSRKDPIIKLLYVTPEKVRLCDLCIYTENFCFLTNFTSTVPVIKIYFTPQL